ncbi:MAG: sigma-70 family RNA polymerase sigma factor [Bacteroidetes bacterium]|nr:sigma-70 family RNA polymerase sigma factor [Bacteroidota bacterium]MDA1120824.1 sigma-70 family RNA polymerase sigma factor [Bacteroidota bacterium]
MPVESKELIDLLKRCEKGERKSQDDLYKQFYGYAMGVSLRYSQNRDEAVEILNLGFFKVLTQLNKYNRELSFKGWLRRIMINSAIDYYRRNKKHQHLDVSYAKDERVDFNALDQLSEKEILGAIQQLPPSYKIVFNLHVIEGYKHEEIAEQLSISVGTSKSNLAVARNKLQKILKVIETERLRNHG